MHRGFIALMSVIIISAILLVVILGGNLIGFYSRFNVLDAESKARSSALADACADILLFQLYSGATIVPGTIAVGSDTCKIVTATSPYQIQAIFNNAYTNLRITVDPSTLAVTSWQETPN